MDGVVEHYLSVPFTDPQMVANPNPNPTPKP